jgi:hypothetical protein
MTQNLAAIFIFMAIAALGAEAEKILPVINEVELWQQVGQLPYELTWTQRNEHPKTLVNFEDLSGWTLELHGGASGEVRRSREQQMWGKHVAKFLFTGTGEKSRVIARPPKPVPIPGSFDVIDLWGYGSRWFNDPAHPIVSLAILLEDARGNEFRIGITEVTWRHWWLIHRRIPSETLALMTLPAAFSGLEISRLTNKEPRYFYCDSLAIYAEELKPLQFQPQPRRNLKPFRGQIAGLNTGPGTLPFPTREETILPENRTRDFQTTVCELEPGRFEWRYEGQDTALVYTYSPRTGNLGEITAHVNGHAPFRPLNGGGVLFADTVASRVAEGRLLSASLVGESVISRFAMGSRVVECEFRLWQKSLVIDVWCDGGVATELSFGRVTGVSQPRLIRNPYITYQAMSFLYPRVLVSGGQAAPLFTSVWFDWYRSNASEPYYVDKPMVTADTAEINGGLRYNPKTDGQRNNLYERIFLTVSPRYEEVLPTIANPPSLRQQEGKQVLWTVTEPESFKQDHALSRRIRSYGINKIMQHSHEATWRDDTGSFTLRDRAAPQKGGDAMLQWYIRAQGELGWLQGTYCNYTDLDPVNTNWNPDWVQRSPDGEWRRAWFNCYALKPAKAVELDAFYSRRLKGRYDIKMSYTDVHSSIAPWVYCDSDARVPGAGTFAATYYAYGQILLNDQSVCGPTQSEATLQWLYAGLASGHYGWVQTRVNLLTEPLDVAFKLLKIQPLECDYGMGYTYFYLEQIDKDWMKSPKRRELVDLFLATTIGYGNMGWLIKEWGLDEPFGVEVLARSYYMMQQLQQQYAFVSPRTIQYADRLGNFLSPSQAHATGVIADSRLHVEYENGAHVYVNRSSQRSWTVKDHTSKAVELPVSGWLVFNEKNGFYEFSANIDGKRIDYVKAPEYEFLDGRGQWTEQGSLGATGSVARRERGGGVVELIDIYGNSRIGFKAESVGQLMAYDWEDNCLGKVELKSVRAGWYEFRPVSSGRRYVFANVQ